MKQNRMSWWLCFLYGNCQARFTLHTCTILTALQENYELLKPKFQRCILSKTICGRRCLIPLSRLSHILIDDSNLLLVCLF